MTLDIAMGGSTNTILHLLAMASYEGEDAASPWSDIDRLSAQGTGHCIKAVALNYRGLFTWKMCTGPEASMRIMGELDRAWSSASTDQRPTVHSENLRRKPLKSGTCDALAVP